jgi:phosphate starvation-inducible protein PhoH and related proteins
MKKAKKRDLELLQNDKIARLEHKNNKSLSKHDLEIIKPLTDAQEEMMKSYMTGSSILATGSAGSGKTLIALYLALNDLLDKKQPQREIRIIRSVVATRDIGFLPGPQPLDANILTPTGWTTMGKLSIGNYIIAKDGFPTEVIGIYPKGTKSVYKVTTTDGTSTECCEDHLWYTTTAEEKKRGKNGCVKSTREIMNTIQHFPRGKKINSYKPRYGDIRPNHFLPRNDTVQYEKREVTIPPYVLGCILGDGSISGSISVASVDHDIVKRIEKEIKPLDMKLTYAEPIHYTFVGNYDNNKPAKPVKLTNQITNETQHFETRSIAANALGISPSSVNDRCTREVIMDNWKYEFLPCPVRWQNLIKNSLYELGLEGTKSNTKFIPDDYKYTSVQDRLELLRGLLDTDGTIKESSGEICYYTVSKQLALDVSELVRSLGGRVRLRNPRSREKVNPKVNGHDIVYNHACYEINIALPNGICPFHCKRKAERTRDRKYMHGVGIVSIDYVGEKEVQCIKISNPDHLYLTDDFIVTHNTMDEKIEVYETPYRDMFSFLFGGMPTCYNNFKDRNKVHFMPTSFLRGQTWDNAIVVIDEAQNMNFHEINTVMTRIGHNSKVIIVGDSKQTDLYKTSRDSSYMTELERVLRNNKFFDIIHFNKHDIVRSDFVKSWIECIED